ncbi:hypothetical protein Bca4012_019945 [Brassica carinata]
MAESHPLSSPMVVRSLGLDTDPFRPKMDGEDVLGPEVPYLSAIGALMFSIRSTQCSITDRLCFHTWRYGHIMAFHEADDRGHIIQPFGNLGYS